MYVVKKEEVFEAHQFIGKEWKKFIDAIGINFFTLRMKRYTPESDIEVHEIKFSTPLDIDGDNICMYDGDWLINAGKYRQTFTVVNPKDFDLYYKQAD